MSQTAARDSLHSGNYTTARQAINSLYRVFMTRFCITLMIYDALDVTFYKGQHSEI